MRALRETLFAPQRKRDLQGYCRFGTKGPQYTRAGAPYRAALAYELRKRGLEAIEERPIPAIYEEVRLDLGFRADIIVNGKVVIEAKSIEALAPIHSKVLLTYLRLTDLRLGLLINFNVELIKDAIRRVVNKL